jgi:hypothetical protein
MSGRPDDDLVLEIAELFEAIVDNALELPPDDAWLGPLAVLAKLADQPHLRYGCWQDRLHANPTPFTWTKDPNKIIAAVKRGQQVLDSVH